VVVVVAADVMKNATIVTSEPNADSTELQSLQQLQQQPATSNKAFFRQHRVILAVERTGPSDRHSYYINDHCKIILRSF